MIDLARGVVIDSSVLVADARPSEREHPPANALLGELARRGAIQHLPVIALAEVASAISRGVGDAWLAQRIADGYRRRRGYRNPRRLRSRNHGTSRPGTRRREQCGHFAGVGRNHWLQSGPNSA